MPKDEFDPEDPMQLFGVGLLTEEDTTGAMAECFVEEFMRLGHSAPQIYALFQNPFYLGVNSVLQNRGERFVRDVIAEVFARWGKTVPWPDTANDPGSSGAASTPERGAPLPHKPGHASPCAASSPEHAPQPVELDETAADPTGAPLPKLNF